MAALSLGVLFLVIPAVSGGIVYGIFDARRGGRAGLIALLGLAFGIASVFIYDAVARFPFIFAGLMADFIPRIHGWLTGAGEQDWRIGYAWRYFGNGGGMGLAFTSLYAQWKPAIGARLSGIAFGSLFLAPNGEAKLFPVTSLTIVVSFIGHVVYGATLGSLNGLLRARGLAAQRETQ